MGKFLARRLVNYLILIMIAGTAGYLLAATALHPRERFQGRNPPIPEASIDHKLDDLNMNDKTPVMERFGHWVTGVAKADFGKTINGEPVWPEMKRRMGVSLRLLLIGSLLGAGLGVLAGVVCAVKQYKLTDNAITVWSFVLLSTPVFVLAIILKFVALRINQKTGMDPPLLSYTGEYTPGKDTAFFANLSDRFRHLILPTAAIVLGQIASYSRYQRSTMLDVLGSDFLRTARAKGLRRRTALLKHGLRTAVIPLSTFFAYGFTLLITGATFTEKLFGWHGMGEWFIDSVTKADINAVGAVIVFDAVLVLLAGLLADLAYAALDPRVRIQ